MSPTGIAVPREDVIEKRFEASVSVFQVRADDIARNFLHPCDGFEPTPFRVCGFSKECTRLRGDFADPRFGPNGVQVCGVFGYRLDMLIDQTFAVQLNGTVY